MWGRSVLISEVFVTQSNDTSKTKQVHTGCPTFAKFQRGTSESERNPYSVFHVWEFHVSGAEGGCVFHRGPSKFDRGDLRLCRLIAAGGATASFAALFTSVASGAGSRSHCYRRWG
jgi:hypothetical protein